MMMKLLKYEFRKSLTSLLILLSVVGAGEIYFLGALALDNTDHMAYAVILLAVCAYAAMVYVLVRALTSYSNELKSKSAYLLFMTPNSGLRIMGSKYLYTFVNALLMGAVSALLFGLDITLIFSHRGDLESLFTFVSTLLRQAGIYLDQIGLFIAVILISAVLSILSFFALSYLAVTLSHTLLRNKKYRALVAFLFFIGLEYLVGWIGGQFESPASRLVMVADMAETTSASAMVTGLNELIPLMIPSACLSLVCVLGSLFGCGWMLDKKVSL